jgi:hypothetical protein
VNDDLAYGIFCSLTREEFQLCSAVAFLDQLDRFRGAYDLGRYATPGMGGPTNQWVELIRRAVRFLGLEAGMEFKSLQPKDDGRIFSGGIVEEGNAAYLLQLRGGGLHNIELATETAIRMAKELSLKMDLTPLRSALGQYKADRMITEAITPQEDVARVRRLRRAAVRDLVASAKEQMDD